MNALCTIYLPSIVKLWSPTDSILDKKTNDFLMFTNKYHNSMDTHKDPVSKIMAITQFYWKEI